MGWPSNKLRVRAQFGDEVADRVTDQILTVLGRLEKFPDSGVPTPDPWLNEMGFRMVIADKRNVSIFRRYGDEILVYLIADTRTDYVRVFKSTLL